MNANFGLLDDLAETPRDKALKRAMFAERALLALREWRDSERL